MDRLTAFCSSSFFPSLQPERLVEMWKSRVVCEISKRLWKSILDFRSRGISTADYRHAAAARRSHSAGLIRPTDERRRRWL